MACYPSITAHSIDILIPTVAYYAPSEPPELLFISDFLRRCRYTAVGRV